MRKNNGVPTWRMKATLACLSILFTYSVIEVAYRYKVSRKVAAGKYAITVLGEKMSGSKFPGYFVQNKTIKYRMFSESHDLLKENKVVTNNFGFISGNDYQVAKPVGEFRIVVLGDSLTACETNDFPWADALERHLNADEALKNALRATSFRVLNLGLSGSGFPRMTYNYIRYGEQFSPDLLLVNFIEDDFLREPNADVVAEVHAAELRRKQDVDGTDLNGTPRNIVHMGDIDIFVHNSRPEQLPDLRDPAVTPSRLFIIPDDRVAFDKARLNAVKAEIATTMLRHRLWYSLYPYALANLFGQEFTLDYSRFVASMHNPSRDAAVGQAARFMAALGKRHPKVLLMHNPLYGDLVPPKAPALTSQLRQKLPEATIIEMAGFLPTDKGDAEITSWYNLPFDGHWSNKGAEVYAAAIHRAFQQVLPSFMERKSENPHASETLSAKPRSTR